MSLLEKHKRRNKEEDLIIKRVAFSNVSYKIKKGTEQKVETKKN